MDTTYDFVGYGSNHRPGSALKCQNTPIELMIYFICEVVLIITENRYLLLKIFHTYLEKDPVLGFVCMHAVCRCCQRFMKCGKQELVDTLSGSI